MVGYKKSRLNNKSKIKRWSAKNGTSKAAGKGKAAQLNQPNQLNQLNQLKKIKAGGVAKEYEKYEEHESKSILKKLLDQDASDISLLLMAVFIGLYIILKWWIFGLLSVLSLLFSIYFDIKKEVIETGFKGLKSYLKDIAVSFLVIFGLWLLSVLILGTDSPYNVVVSCSMLPNLERGDIVVLKGVDVTKINAPILKVSNKTVEALFSDSKLFGVCAACNATVCSPERLPKNFAGVFIYSLSKKQIVIPQTNITCGLCEKTYANNTKTLVPCVKSINLDGTAVIFSLGNRSVVCKKESVIVYKTNENEGLKGDIIHRAVVILNESGRYYVLTKGDNNPDLDLQYGVQPKSQEDIKGVVVFRVPILGYLKLFLFGMYNEPNGCNFVFTK